MKIGKSIIKIITVTSSATLMAGFVAFEAEAFHEYLGFETGTPPDSLKKDSTETDLDMDIHFHSSKSFIPDFPIEPIVSEELDSILRLDSNAVKTDIDSSKKDDSGESNKPNLDDYQYMGSSKSVRSHYVTEELNKTDTLKRVHRDSINSNIEDSKKEQKKKKKKQK